MNIVGPFVSKLDDLEAKPRPRSRFICPRNALGSDEFGRGRARTKGKRTPRSRFRPSDCPVLI